MFTVEVSFGMLILLNAGSFLGGILALVLIITKLEKRSRIRHEPMKSRTSIRIK